MGAGKGSPEYWVSVVKPGRVLHEMDGIPEYVAKAAMRLAAHKMPVQTRFLALTSPEIIRPVDWQGK